MANIHFVMDYLLHSFEKHILLSVHCSKSVKGENESSKLTPAVLKQREVACHTI